MTVPETQSTIPETEEYREEPEEPSSQRADQQTGNDSDLEQQQAVTSSSQRVYFDLKNFQVVSKNLQETPPTNPPNLDTEHEPGTQGGDTEDVNNAADQDTLAILPLLHANPGTQTQEVYQRCLNAIDSALKVCESSSVDGAADPINDQSGENLFSQDAQNSQTSSDSDEQAAAEPSPPKSAVKKSRYGRVLKKSGK